MARKRKPTTEPAVSGPGIEDRSVPSLGAGISLASTAASQATETGTWYVRDQTGTVQFHVTRDDARIVTIERAQEATT
jgi:hypothetical protein